MLVYDIQLTTNDIKGIKRKYTMTNLIEDYVYSGNYLTEFDYDSLLDEELGTFSFELGDGVMTFRLTSTSRCIMEELD